MKTILIADDHDHLRLLVAKTLGGSSYRIVEACDGNEAYDLVQRERPDLVILDWMMPGKSGLEVAQALRDDPTTEDLPIIMLTARAQSSDRASALASGVRAYIVKPFSPLELMELVEKVLDEMG